MTPQLPYSALKQIFARFAEFSHARCLTRARFEMCIAKSAIAATRDDRFLARRCEVRNDFAVAAHERTNRNFDVLVFAGTASHFAFATIDAVVGCKAWLVTKRKQRIELLARNKNHVAATSTVAAIRAAFVDINLMPKTDGSIAAFASLNGYGCSINKHIVSL